MKANKTYSPPGKHARKHTRRAKAQISRNIFHVTFSWRPCNPREDVEFPWNSSLNKHIELEPHMEFISFLMLTIYYFCRQQLLSLGRCYTCKREL